MKLTFFSSTNEVTTEVGRRLKAVRVDASMTQQQLADMTNLSLKTISNLETGKDVSFSTVIEVLRALGLLQSLELAIPEQTIRPSQLLKLGKPRERVRATPQPHGNWRWGDEE